MSSFCCWCSVAGIIGAKNNEFGVVGVAPNTSIVAVKVMDNYGRGTMGNVIKGVEYVAQQGKRGDVANISLSGNGNEALDKAIKRAAKLGIRFTVSAGNGSKSAITQSPARVNHRNVKTICASDKKDQLAWFSNTGAPPIDWCAPGTEIYSTYKDGGYATMYGTSMSSPHAAGVYIMGKPTIRNTAAVSDQNGIVYDLIGCRSE
jgi:subtilisin family serine protease